LYPSGIGLADTNGRNSSLQGESTDGNGEVRLSVI